jgi:hypothetical protein
MALTAVRRNAVLGLIFITITWLGLAGHALADTQSMNCNGDRPSKHAELAKDDQNTATHLQFTRKLPLGAALDLDVCAADLTIKGTSGDQLQVTVDIGKPASNLTAGDYLQTLDVTGQQATVRLHLPKNVRAKVVVVVPEALSKLELNLVRGDLSFETERIAGEREINLVHGHADLLANDDSYSTLHVNIVMGSLHDRRKGGEDHRFMVSQELSGTGRGSIEINVVAGSVDLRPWD